MDIEKLREKIKSVTIIEVARKTLLHTQTIYNFRSGKNLRPRNIKKLEEYARIYLN